MSSVARKQAYQKLKNAKLGWGKHKDLTIAEIYKKDNQYLKWLVSSEHRKYLGKNLNDVERLFNLPLTEVKPKVQFELYEVKNKVDDLSDDDE